MSHTVLHTRGRWKFGVADIKKILCRSDLWSKSSHVLVVAAWNVFPILSLMWVCALNGNFIRAWRSNVMSLVSESLNKNMKFMDSPNFTFVTYKSIIGLPIIRNSHSKKIMHFLALDLELWFNADLGWSGRSKRQKMPL